MEVKTFVPGPQVAGTLLFDRYGNVVKVVKNMANAQALPSVGAYYTLVMTKEEYAAYLEKQKPVDPNAPVNWESSEFGPELKKALLFLKEHLVDYNLIITDAAGKERTDLLIANKEVQ